MSALAQFALKVQGVVMDARYTWAWMSILLLGLAWEIAGWISGHPGRTLSAHVVKVQDRLGWEGIVIWMVLGWLLPHWGRGNQPLGWWDAAGVAFGLLCWYGFVYLRVKGGTP